MAHFNLEHEIAELRLKQVFTISRGSKRTVNNVIVRFQGEDSEGIGEAAPNKRYDEDAEKVIQYLDSFPADFFENISSAEELSQKLDSLEAIMPVKSAQAAIEMAWLDWWAGRQEKPLWRVWEADSNRGPVTSFTIGLDELEIMQEKVRKAVDYPILKVKLGTDRDRQIVGAIRDVTDKPLRVDANEGWETLEEAKEAIDFLTDHNIQMVEQPMPADSFSEMVKLKSYSPIPLCADESYEGEEDLELLSRAFDIINIKLMKIGSLVKARAAIAKARQLGLKIMIGCMIESSVANTAGAVLSLWADYADLDGHLLIENDPYSGLGLTDNKQIIVPDIPGLGVSKNEPLS